MLVREYRMRVSPGTVEVYLGTVSIGTLYIGAPLYCRFLLVTYGNVHTIFHHGNPHDRSRTQLGDGAISKAHMA